MSDDGRQGLGALSGSREPSPAVSALPGFDPARDDAVVLADAIVRAWERAKVPFDKSHEIQLALVAAQFLVRIANSREQSERAGA